jgi:ribosomal protein S18 acetylase RimI-like enzyme
MSADIEVRPYREGDEDGVCALWALAFPNPARRNEPRLVIAQKVAFQRELFYVAAAERAIVGTAMGGFDGHRGWLYTVAVHPSWRRRGIGSALVRRVEAALEALGCLKLNLQVLSSNASVVGFYRSLGYAVEERISMGKLLR